MDIILTGTGSPLPDPNRAGPSTLVKAGDTHILVDAGRGVVMRMAAAGSDPSLLAGVLITHLHSDHICALNDVITTHWVRTRELVPLNVFGPVGIARFVERQLHALEDDIGYRVEHHDPLVKGPQVEVTELRPGDEFRIGDVDVTTAATNHAPVHPTIGFRLEHEGAVAALVGDTTPCDGVDQLAADSRRVRADRAPQGHHCAVARRDGARHSRVPLRSRRGRTGPRPAWEPSGSP